MKGISQTQDGLNDLLAAKMVELNNQILSLQIITYSLVDVIIEKELLTKEELESMIDDKKVILEKWVKEETKNNKTDDSSYMMYFGKPGDA
jgi:hypothetical protein